MGIIKTIDSSVETVRQWAREAASNNGIASIPFEQLQELESLLQQAKTDATSALKLAETFETMINSMARRR